MSAENDIPNTTPPDPIIGDDLIIPFIIGRADPEPTPDTTPATPADKEE